MKRYFNKALFFKELKYCVWFSMVISIQYLILIMNFLTDMKNEPTASIINTQSYFNNKFEGESFNIFIIVVLIAMAIWICGIDKNTNGYETLGAMYFSREEIIGTKIITAFLAAIVPMLALFLILQGIVSLNSMIFAPFPIRFELLKWLIINILAASFVIVFSMFIQCISGKLTIGIIFNVVLLLVPNWIFALATDFLANIVGRSVFMYLFRARSIVDKVTIAVYNIDYDNEYLFRICILIVFTLIFAAAAIAAFKKSDIEKGGYVVLFSWLEPIVAIGASACLGMLISVIAASAFRNSSLVMLVTIITFLICGGLSYILIKKYMRFCKK